MSGLNMPVLLVGNFLSSSGGSRGVCEELAVRLADGGSTVFTTSSKPARWRRLADMLWVAYKRRGQYAVAQVDVYSGPAFIWAEAVGALLRWLNKPYVLTLHGGNLPRFAREHPARVGRLLNSARMVTTPSRFLLEKMSGYRGELRLLPNALDLGRYAFRLRETPDPSLIWLRAFHKIYNPSLAPKVLRLLADDFPGIRLTMAGPDKGDGSLQLTRATAEKLGVLDRIKFTGAVPKAEVPRWLAQADVFLNTTNVDNTPVSVLEAMACGLCVVSTDVGGLPYLLEGGRHALLTPPNDPKAMAVAVARVLKQSRLARRLSQNARTLAEEHDWSFILPQWLALFQSVVETSEAVSPVRQPAPVARAEEVKV